MDSVLPRLLDILADILDSFADLLCPLALLLLALLWLESLDFDVQASTFELTEAESGMVWLGPLDLVWLEPPDFDAPPCLE